MAWGLPKLPGLTFSDPTKIQHHMRSSLRIYQGHRFPDTSLRAPGGEATDVDSNAFALPDDSVNYDPSLTYGRVKQPALPAVVPHWVHYDKRCLNFTAFFKQPVYENPNEAFRVRVVNIVYFIEDDTITVMEPRVKNSGLWQGRMIKRGKIPKNDLGEFWHWKDLDVGKDICMFGKVFHTVSCDLFTKEWLESQGIELSKEEELPVDQYTQRERWKTVPTPHREAKKEDRLRRYLEYDGKVLAFDVYWDNRDAENGELTHYKLLYFLQDDTISIKELHDGRGGKEPFPLLLKKRKLPKKWNERPVSFPSIVMEVTDEEVTEYYSPSDLIVGETVFVLGRRFLISDCDPFTRRYYQTMLNIEQPPRVEILEKKTKEFAKVYPPHTGIGTPEDSLQNCFGLVPKPPHKDVIKYNLNANKNLRYLCELEWIHPEDKGRQFVLSYSLADGKIKIGEIPRRNSGIKGGKFLKAMLLQTPESDPSFPTYFTPERFYIGAIVPVFKHRFKIIGCDLFVYRYMSANPEKFPQEVIDNVRNYHLREGNLKDELQDAIREGEAAAKRAELLKQGQSAVAEPNAMERCLAALDVVEGTATPPRPATPPQNTDHLSYEESLRATRLSKPTSDEVMPLKGILKSGAARDDQQKVVCFSGPAPDEHREPARPAYPQYPPGEQPHYNDDPDYCERYKMPDHKERAARRAAGVCAYEVVPSAAQVGAGDDDTSDKPRLPGYLGTYGVDCKAIPEYMKLAPDAYERVKEMRRDIPEISPAAVRVAEHPAAPTPPVEACRAATATAGPCAPRQPEDVAFSCPHVEPKMPCCDPDKRDKTVVTHL
ncbi:EF-hand domain-containing protein 1-like [Cydia pomonella]|uniref:EF-hand domain-containing protein 1-like n=1 Tax=Cydia pomonella TaxID=82600 RepID=UPI002ADE54A8|nr:EF-hand domain-containing protein 1-like [Cydia pomonella]